MWPDPDDVFLRAKKWKGSANGPFFVEQKYDGFHVLVTNEAVWSSRASTVTFEHTPLPVTPPWPVSEGTAIECELLWPGHPAAEVPTAIKTCPDQLRFVPFAVPFHRGVDCRCLAYVAMHQLMRNVTGFDMNYQVYKTINVELLLESARQLGYEGWVVKEYGYAGWWKLKVEDTLDLRVVGFKPGTGKYYGKVGALILADASGEEVAYCSGMTDEERFALTDADIGRICEVKYNGVTKYRRLRHPRFLRWRDDKGEPNALQGDEARE